MKQEMATPESRDPQPPRTKAAQVRLDELMAAAECLFLAKGFEATTISEVAAQAQVAKGTFYCYFSSKNEMLEALAGRYTMRFLERLQAAVDACPVDDWLARLSAWVHASVEIYARTFRTHDMVYAGRHHDRSSPARNAMLEQLQGIIEGGKAAGAWEAAHPKVAALLIYSGVHGATDEAIAAGADDCAPFAQAVADSCLCMLGPRAEHLNRPRR